MQDSVSTPARYGGWQMTCRWACTCILVAFVFSADAPAAQPTREQARNALLKAVRFYHSQVATEGGYLWQYSGDLSLREGEGKATDTMIWVQPPGTPTVAESLLDAYETTGEKLCLDAARDAAYALVRGQLRTGGWAYHIDFDPEKRLKHAYRLGPKRNKQRNKSTLDDDTTQSASRFLMRIDKTLEFADPNIHGAAAFALDAILKAQYPNGAWYQWWDKIPNDASLDEYPVIKASYPPAWSRTWPNDWTGRYFLNDNVIPDVIDTLLQAYDTYGGKKYLASALKAGDFLLLAQMPDPQPAWAQQYDPNMHPVWDRRFEPPAITGSESQRILETLLVLYSRTGQKKYLGPVPLAIAYFRASLLPDGRLARFYELKTNRPLYFTKDYKLTYSDADVPTHYSFSSPSRLDVSERRYKQLLDQGPPDRGKQKPQQPTRPSPALRKQVQRIIAAMDNRGAWVQPGRLRTHKTEPASGVINSRTFVSNLRTLCQFLTAAE